MKQCQQDLRAMRWKQTEQKVLPACGAAVSVEYHHHLTFLSFSCNSQSFSPRNPGDSFSHLFWKALTLASWNQHCREERAAVWPPPSDWVFRPAPCTLLVSWDSFLLQDPCQRGGRLLRCLYSLEDRRAFLLMGQGWDSGGCVCMHYHLACAAVFVIVWANVWCLISAISFHYIPIPMSPRPLGI